MSDETIQKSTGGSDKRIRCVSCGIFGDEAKEGTFFIALPKEVYICSQCVEICSVILKAKRRSDKRAKT